MKQSTLLLFTSIIMSMTGVLFLWGHWEILTGIFFLLFGNNLMNKGVAKQDEERRYSWWRREASESVTEKELKDILQQTWDRNSDVRERH